MGRQSAQLVIVGAGPAGSACALHAARGGLEVLLLEKRQQVGFPVRCAEAVGREGFAAELGAEPAFFPEGPAGDPAPGMLADLIDGGALVAPDGTTAYLEKPRVGYVLERKIFDLLLAEEAVRCGAELWTKTRAVGLRRDGDRWRIIVHRHGSRMELETPLVVGADGVEGLVGRWAGLKTPLKPGEIHSCAQVLAAGLGDEVRPRSVYFHLGSRLAPRGYLWIFPKGPGRANIGLGLRGPVEGPPARAHLEAFLNANFPKASVLEEVHGCVPTTEPPTDLAADGLLLIGDAARQVDPFSGAGINWALEAGRLAAETAAAALTAERTPTLERLKTYERSWRRAHRREHQKLLRVKNFVDELTDEEINRAAAALAASAGELGEFSVGRMLGHILRRDPGLLWKARKLL